MRKLHFWASLAFTVRENNERPFTTSMGPNQLVGRDLQKLRSAAAANSQYVARNRGRKPHAVPNAILGRTYCWARRRKYCATRNFLSGRFGAELGLQLGAGVGVDFAIQANFFKSGCCPLHS